MLKLQKDIIEPTKAVFFFMLRIFYELNLGHTGGNITKFKYKPKNTGVDVSWTYLEFGTGTQLATWVRECCTAEL